MCGILDVLIEEMPLPTAGIYRWDLESSGAYIWGYDENIKEEVQQKEQGIKHGISGFTHIWSQQHQVKPRRGKKQ